MTRLARRVMGTVLFLAGGSLLVGSAPAGQSQRVVTFAHGAIVGVALDSSRGQTIVAGGDARGQQVSIFETASGRRLRTVGLQGRLQIPIEFGPNSTLTLDRTAARAYITTYDHPTASGPAQGYINIVDTHRGLLLGAVSPLLRTTMVGSRGGALLARTLPVAVTADEPTGRAFVVNSTDYSSPQRGSVTVLDAHSGRIVGEVLTGKNPGDVVVDQTTGAAFVLWQRTKHASGEPAEALHLSLLDGRNGHVVWTITLPYGGHLLMASGLDRLFLIGSAGEGMPYLGHLTVIDTRRHVIVRTLALDALGTYAFLTLDARGGRAYLVSSAGMPDASGDEPARLRILQARTGALLHTTSLHGTPWGISLAARQGRLVVLLAHESQGTHDRPGSLVILDARSGRVLHTSPVGSNPVGFALEARGAQAYVAAMGQRAHDYPYWTPEGAGTLSVVETGTGVVRRTIALGVQPLPPVVDENAHRVVVLSQGGGVPRRGTRTVHAWRLMPGTLTLLEVRR